MIWIVLVVSQHRRALLEPDIAVDAPGDLGELGACVGIKLTGKDVVVHRAERREQQRQNAGVRQRQVGAEGAPLHGALSVSMYPTPRIV